MKRFCCRNRLALILGLAIVACSGCSRWSLFGDPSDHVPGIMLPGERIKAIRQMGKEAREAGPASQEQLAQRLAALYPQEGDPIIRSELVRAASELHSATAATFVRQAAKDSNLDVRLAVCRALEKQSDPESTRVLAEMLGSDVETDVRLAAARALGERNDPTVLASLGAALEDRDPAVQNRVVQSLRQVAPQDLGNDIDRWRQYAKGEPVGPPKPVSLVERMQESLY